MRTSRKITYSAVSVALASVAILIGRFSPVRFVPLMVASVCFFMALRCGLGYGLMSMAASMLLTFFWGSIDLSVLLTALLFAPYSLAAYFMHGLRYRLPVIQGNENGRGQNPAHRGVERGFVQQGLAGRDSVGRDSAEHQNSAGQQSSAGQPNSAEWDSPRKRQRNFGKKTGINPVHVAVRMGVTTALFNAALALIVFVLFEYVGEILFGFNPLEILDKVGMPLGYILLAVFGSVYMVGFDIMFVSATDILDQRLRIAAKPSRINNDKIKTTHINSANTNTATNTSHETDESDKKDNADDVFRE